MVMPEDKYRDLMRRTISNYEFIRDNRDKHEVYEVTQLLLSFIAVVGYPREREIGDLLKGVTMERWHELGLPAIPVISSDPSYSVDTVNDLAAMLRNAAAHGRIDFSANEGSKEIGYLTFSDRTTIRGVGPVTRTTTPLDVALVERILYGFRDLAEQLFLERKNRDRQATG